MQALPDKPISATRDWRASVASRWLITGRVQGVGFRPFVSRLARQYGLHGWVRNRLGTVEVLAQGDSASLDSFAEALLQQAPGLARPALVARESVAPGALDGFTILDSTATGDAQIHLPADLCICDDCIRELNDPDDRRYRYPFINCTQCGPRYSLIGKLPYDRSNTSMAAFELCPACAQEYQDPTDRRFHAEPVACPDCGPSLEFRRPGQRHIQGNEAALSACITALADAKVVAVKGIGGYHLVCDAASDRAVRTLRAHKPRPHKPLAVMFPAPADNPLGPVSAAVRLSESEQQLLLSAERPIVLAPTRSGSGLSPLIAPGLGEIGVFLPYSPLHHVLLNDFGAPLVATSANPRGEPVLTENEAAETRLAHIAEAFLHHNRPIVRVADDPVYRTLARKPRPIRLGRGNAPREIELPVRLQQPLLAVGGQTKNTLCLAWHDRAVISPHIGDLTSPRSLALFRHTLRDLQSLYRVEAEAVVCDAHPGYASTHWAERCGLPVTRVFHHAAHAASAWAPTAGRQPWLVFSWDGVGYGDDGTLWGGEALLGQPGTWRRVASLRPFHIPGGERAGREPWRSAAALCWEAGIDWDGVPGDAAFLHHAWSKRLNTPQTSAAGRLFDAAAALTGICLTSSYEGQGPMYLEAVADPAVTPLTLPLTQNGSGLWLSDWSVLIPLLLDDSKSVAERAGCFHSSMAHCLLQQALRIRAQHGVRQVAFSGGVFQNRRLVGQATALLEAAGFSTHVPATVPVNDAGLSYGQILECACGAGSAHGI